MGKKHLTYSLCDKKTVIEIVYLINLFLKRSCKKLETLHQGSCHGDEKHWKAEQIQLCTSRPLHLTQLPSKKDALSLHSRKGEKN